jgi:hypothetical protein
VYVIDTASVLCDSSSSWWDQLWPSLVATIAGVIIGLPAALWLNRQFTAGVAKTAELEAKRRLRAASETVLESLSANDTRLARLLDVLEENGAMFDPRVDVATWAAVESEIVAHLRDAKLKGKLAYHFAALGSLNRLSSVYLETSAGINVNVLGAGEFRQELRTHLIEDATALRGEADDLEEALEAVIAELPPPAV